MKFVLEHSLSKLPRDDHRLISHAAVTLIAFRRILRVQITRTKSLATMLLSIKWAISANAQLQLI